MINSITLKCKILSIRSSEKVKRYSIAWVKIFAKPITSNAFVSRVYKELLQSMRKGLKAQSKGKRYEQALLRKENPSSQYTPKDVSPQL